MDYRREIDGLRALAVVPVILFHAGLSVFGGGFVGVDVFFVISGYLITSILLLENEAGRFSVTRFYERRARRILPALFLVVAVCIPCAWIWLLPNDMLAFGKSVVAVVLFISNLHFKSESGYFDTAVELKPLLHTWSLAVEEQYYLFFPLFMVMAWRLGRRWMFALLLVVAIWSLLAAQWGQASKPAATYFLLSTRGWELLIGSFTAFYAAKWEPLEHGRWLGEAGSLAGLLMLAYAIFAFDKATPFPGFYALVPTLGTALIIVFSTPRTLAGQLLGTPVFVKLGLISYSAYLWHQPLLAFARYRSLLEPSQAVLLVLCLTALVLAYLSWRFVEAPFRQKDRYTRRQIFVFSLAGSVALLTCGGLAWAFHGFESRAVAAHLPRDYFARSWIEYGGIAGVDGRACISEAGSLCRVHASPGHRKILLVGDSHSADFTSAFRRFTQSQQVDAWQISVGGCAYIPAHAKRHNGDCGRARKLVEESVDSVKFDEIFVVTNMDDHMDQVTKDARRLNMDAFIGLLSRMLGSGAKVTYFRPRPDFNASPTRAAALDQFQDLKVMRRPSRDYVAKRVAELAVDHPALRVFDQYGVLIRAGCGDVDCFNGHTPELVPLYRDAGHLTSDGAKLVFDALVASLVPTNASTSSMK